jgi:hypothetical protein
MAILVQLYEARWLLLSAVLAIYAGNKYRKYQRLAQFKGPFSTGWSEFWHSWTILTFRSHLIYYDVTEKYGKN